MSDGRPYRLPRRTELVVCDDIRQEASGKQIYIGVYGAEIQFPTFPSVYPQLFFVLTVRGELEDIPQENLSFEVRLPGQESGFARIDVSSKEFQSLNNFDPSAHYYSIIIHFRVSPLLLKEPGTITVLMFDEKGEHLVARMKVTENPSLVPVEQLESVKRNSAGAYAALIQKQLAPADQQP